MSEQTLNKIIRWGLAVGAVTFAGVVILYAIVITRAIFTGEICT
jgi:hypothetical protein